MKSKYSIRLYEYIKSIKSKGYRQVITLEELRERMGIDAETLYKYKDFRVRALEPAAKEINTYTDIHIEYKEIKTSRSITALEFIIQQNEEAKAHINRMKALGQLP